MRSLAAAALLLCAAVPATAGSIEIAPTTIEIPASGNAVVYVTNNGNTPVVAQIQPYDWQQSAQGESLTPSNALEVSPPMSRLVPGQRQIVRLAVPPGSTGTEKSYRILVSELPDPQSPPAQGVRVLLQFSVPVFTTGTPGS